MKASALAWLGVLVLPGCLLIQPLDDAKPAGSAGSGQHAGGSGPGTGGAGNKAGSGPLPLGGAPNNGGSGGVDFSLFLGGWTLISGDYAKQCTSETAPRTGTIDPGEVDTFVLGTQASQSDLIFDLEGMDVCDISANVDDRTAYGTGEQSCTVAETDGSTSYLDYSYFEFAVSDDGQSAVSTWDVSAFNDADTDTCVTEIRAQYQRTTPNN